MYGYFNNDPLLSCSAFHYVSTMLFPISNIHEKETRKQQQQTNEKRQKNQKLNENKTKTTKHTKKLPPPPSGKKTTHTHIKTTIY